jgi:hypothetical protein
MTIHHPDYSAFIGMGHNQPSELLEITKLADAQYAAQTKVDKLEEDLKGAKEDLRILAEQKLPEAMENAGISEYTTVDGVHVEVKEKVRGSLPAENKAKGYQWCENAGFAGLIESKVVAPFGREELEEANLLVQELQQKGRIAVLERSIHHSRLDAFIREQLAQGKDIPLDIFNVYRQRVAKVEV